MELQLTNRGKVPLPWSGGHHFYFTLPWSTGRARGDYLLETSATKYQRRDDKGALIDGPRVNARESFAQNNLVDLIHTGLKRDVFAVTETPTGNRLLFRSGISQGSAKDLAVVTWTPDDQAPFYCIEPWMGPPNAAETKVGLHFVAPGQMQKFNVEIRLG